MINAGHISALSQETIIRRTQEYARKGVYVLWLAQWTPYLDGSRYSPRLWEKWIHATYFGRVYYWIKGLKVACYHFDPYLRHVPETSWYSEDGEELTAGGYTPKSKRYRSPTPGKVLNLARDFAPQDREWWKSGDLIVPCAKLFIDRKMQDKKTQRHYFPRRSQGFD